MTEPRVAGSFGARPTITFPAGPPPAEPHVGEPATGHGAPLEPGGVAVVQYTAHLWDGRENRLVESTFNRGTPAALPLGALPAGLDAALRGRRAGSRVTAAIPLRDGTPGPTITGTKGRPETGGPAFTAGPGGPQDVRPRGPQDVRPCGPQDVRPCGPQDVRPCGPQDVRPCGPQDVRPCGPQDVTFLSEAAQDVTFPSEAAQAAHRAGEHAPGNGPMAAGQWADSPPAAHAATRVMEGPAVVARQGGVDPATVEGRPGDGGRVDLFYVVDILGAHAGDAAVEADAGAVAGVSVGGGAAPGVTIPDVAPPSGFAAAVLGRGTGPAVEAGRLLVVQYVAAAWSDRRIVTSTWERGRPEAFTIGDGSVIRGWNRALTGVPAGSRVAMVVPPDDGYGATGQPGLGIGPEETLVYVVDVLAAY
ncbi:FKBP-type peptidyl-prolyl cis-trans isomerase [Nonomuraea ferruginea]|uniref:peptidylprolyl isomerase n=1 Tax=Nonomuraea ferruginea TaxID=46174 RepID=A0ABT4T3G4_9ACTN|nr:FKBP-type peptidyl-prolyl cis-trans isomerase [Nonomuraea ferruginea]MDA0644061.1 FKBP-type peptidyl-prolyl cis-trans isomerase [Nonomuraea ferruginea]